MTIPLTFEVPEHPEPLLLIREWALTLRDGVSRAGEHHPERVKPSDLPGLIRIVVHVPRSVDIYVQALWVLVGVNAWCIRAAQQRLLGHPPYPPVYDMACYEPDPPGVELWGSIESLYQRGAGDCEDVACARIAERLNVGDACRPLIDTQFAANGTTVHHILIENPDGTEEDPSEALGMNLGEPYGDRTIARCRVRSSRPSRQEGRKRGF